MTEKIRSAIAELKNRPWTAATQDLCQLDMGYDTFVRTASKGLYEPSIVVIASRNFPTLVPRGLHHSPALVIWLPTALDQATYLLPYVTPKAVAHTSADLRRRDLVVSWTCVGKSFLASLSALQASIDKQASEGALPLIIASETYTAISVLLLGEDFLKELSQTGSRCGENYYPQREHTSEELTTAMRHKWSLATLTEECIFQESRDSEVLLRPRRAFRPDWIV